MTGEPVPAGEFAAAMARLGGFEPAPRLAVGVSGGADSMALVLLADAWARGQGGEVLALTVDHCLRPESGEEAATVGRWLAARGIAHRILRWEGDKPAGGIQAAARAARHRLLAGACAAEGTLHLALAHHRDDQAETVLLRLARGSGVDGLAGMAPVRADGPVRLVRPLLDMARERLAATCRAFGQDWIEDPSNRNPAYARGRLRAVGQALAAEGLDAAALADTAHRAGRARAALESATAGLLAETASLHPEGWISLDPRRLADVPEEIGLRTLARCLAVVGGAPYPPKSDALERLHSEVVAGLPAGRTLGGCRIMPRRGALLIAREPDLATERLPLAADRPVWWDRRFLIRTTPDRESRLTVARLGGSGWFAAVARRPDLRRLALPEPVRLALPALWDGETLVSALIPGVSIEKSSLSEEVSFRPAVPLGGPAFTVVSQRSCII